MRSMVEGARLGAEDFGIRAGVARTLCRRVCSRPLHHFVVPLPRKRRRIQWGFFRRRIASRTSPSAGPIRNQGSTQ